MLKRRAFVRDRDENTMSIAAGKKAHVLGGDAPCAFQRKLKGAIALSWALGGIHCGLHIWLPQLP